MNISREDVVQAAYDLESILAGNQILFLKDLQAYVGKPTDKEEEKDHWLVVSRDGAPATAANIKRIDNQYGILYYRNNDEVPFITAIIDSEQQETRVYARCESDLKGYVMGESADAKNLLIREKKLPRADVMSFLKELGSLRTDKYAA